MKNFILLSVISLALFINAQQVYSQCAPGEKEVRIKVSTDNYGYEVYWELDTFGHNCGQSPIYAGGNPGQVGCSGGGQRDASAGNGYANNLTFNIGPWCLIENDNYDIISVDDWGDGGAEFAVEVSGFSVYQFSAGSANETFTFKVAEPAAVDLSVEKNLVADYAVTGDNKIKAVVKNLGQNTITSFTFNYAIDAGPTEAMPVSGITLNYGQTMIVEHSKLWNQNVKGTYNVNTWVSNPNNGGPDGNPGNDGMVKTVKMSNSIPDIMNEYVTADEHEVTEISQPNHQLATPRDLDFHPDLERKELWVINMETSNKGGTTVIYSNAGEAGQTNQYKKDGNSWHFMSLPTAIAFGDNGNFGSAPGILDANHSGGSFTGPTLWSSDPAIYAVIGNPPSAQFNGSHLDMLHGSPYSMGIAHETGNVYWIFDSHNEHIVRYDFVEDHGPGQTYHDDAIVRRYTEIVIQRDGFIVPNHMVIDKKTGWMYIADHRQNRILRLDTKSGNVKQSMPLINEVLAEHSQMENLTFETYINTGLTTPCGVAVVEDKLLVSDYATGEIHIYSTSGASPTLLRTIGTNDPGIMGIAVGPDGFIWYVNGDNETVNKVGYKNWPAGTVHPDDNNWLNIYPNPSKGMVYLRGDQMDKVTLVEIIDITGKIIIRKENQIMNGIDVSGIINGNYFVKVYTGDQIAIKQLMKMN